MYEELLREMGLSPNEARVYEALLKTGEASVQTIAIKSKVHRRNVYDAISKLMEKLLDKDYNVLICKPKGNNLEEKLLYHTMVLQQLALQNVKRQKFNECYFMRNKKLKSISSKLIY